METRISSKRKWGIGDLAYKCPLQDYKSFFYGFGSGPGKYFQDFSNDVQAFSNKDITFEVLDDCIDPVYVVTYCFVNDLQRRVHPHHRGQQWSRDQREQGRAHHPERGM